MAPKKVETVIENKTGQGLAMKVGHPRCFVRMASVKVGEDYTLRLCLDWTFQEFVLEGKADAGMRLFVTSDDCCDHERLTVKESKGVLYVETVARKPFGGGSDDAAIERPSLGVTKKDNKLRWRFWVKSMVHQNHHILWPRLLSRH